MNTQSLKVALYLTFPDEDIDPYLGTYKGSAYAWQWRIGDKSKAPTERDEECLTELKNKFKHIHYEPNNSNRSIGSIIWENYLNSAAVNHSAISFFGAPTKMQKWFHRIGLGLRMPFKLAISTAKLLLEFPFAYASLELKDSTRPVGKFFYGVCTALHGIFRAILSPSKSISAIRKYCDDKIKTLTDGNTALKDRVISKQRRESKSENRVDEQRVAAELAADPAYQQGVTQIKKWQCLKYLGCAGSAILTAAVWGTVGAHALPLALPSIVSAAGVFEEPLIAKGITAVLSHVAGSSVSAGLYSAAASLVGTVTGGLTKALNAIKYFFKGPARVSPELSIEPLSTTVRSEVSHTSLRMYDRTQTDEYKSQEALSAGSDRSAPIHIKNRGKLMPITAPVVIHYPHGEITAANENKSASIKPLVS